MYILLNIVAEFSILHVPKCYKNFHLIPFIKHMFINNEIYILSLSIKKMHMGGTKSLNQCH